MREKPEWERRRFLTLVFNLLIVEILFFFFFLGEGEGKWWRKGKGSAFCLSKVEIWDLGSRIGLWHSFVKGKRRVGFKKSFITFFFNIMLTRKIVVTSKFSYIYIYIMKGIKKKKKTRKTFN